VKKEPPIGISNRKLENQKIFMH